MDQLPFTQQYFQFNDFWCKHGFQCFLSTYRVESYQNRHIENLLKEQVLLLNTAIFFVSKFPTTKLERTKGLSAHAGGKNEMIGENKNFRFLAYGGI